MKKYVEQVEKSFLWNKGDVGMSPDEKEREQEDAYNKTRNSFITPSLHLCFFLMCGYLLFVDKNTACMQLIDC